jgi:hypothetical protein
VDESRSSSDDPVPGKIAIGAHMLSATITLFELAGKVVVRDGALKAAVLVANA